MNKLISGLFLCGAAIAANAQTLNWSNTYIRPGVSVVPTGTLCPASGALLVNGWATDVSGATIFGGAVVALGDVGSVAASNPTDGFIPTSVAIVPGDFGRVVGKQHGANGIKVRYFGGGSRFSGPFDYTYTANGTSNDEPLCIGQDTFDSYVCANVQGNGLRQLVILEAVSSGTNPVVSLTDTAIAPRDASIKSSLILAAGDDNNASSTAGGARASAYTINSDGSVSPAFTKTFPNTLSNHVFTSHHLIWGAMSNSFNVLVDDQTVHNANNSTFSHSFTLHAYNGAGTELWTASPRTGTIFRVAVGSIYNTWVLGTDGPGQFLISYGLNGVLRRATSTKATRLAAASHFGAVVGGNEIDGTGHHHIQVTRYSVTGSEMWSVTYASAPTDDDFVTDVAWQSGGVYAGGKVVRSTGQKGLWGALWLQN